MDKESEVVFQEDSTTPASYIVNRQYIRFMMRNSTQVQFTNKGNTNYISTTSIIYQTTYVLYMATCMKDILPLLINIIFLEPELGVYVL